MPCASPNPCSCLPVDTQPRTPHHRRVAHAHIALAAGTAEALLRIPTFDDAQASAHRSFSVATESASIGTIADASATATILDNDLPIIELDPDSPVSIIEGKPKDNRTYDAGVSTSTEPGHLEVQGGPQVAMKRGDQADRYATANGRAKADSDYTAASGTLRFALGETAKTVSVPMLDDAVDEGEERRWYGRAPRKEFEGLMREGSSAEDPGAPAEGNAGPEPT